MPHAMSAILTKIRTQGPQPLAPKSFVQALGDFDFNGTATRGDMMDFLDLALRSILSSDKSTQRRDALVRMTDFAVLDASPHFPHLDVNLIMYQMVLRLLKPERVDQGVFGLCGPAHFIVVLIKSKPLKYVSMAYDLLTKGTTTGDDGFDILPDEHVKDFEPKQSIPEADWLLAASLRNAQTPIPPGKDRAKYEGTNPAAVFAYFKHAGYERIILLSCYQRTAEWMAHAALGFANLRQYEPSNSQEMVRNIAPNGDIHDPITNFRIACKLREIGWRVMLSCNEDLFKYEPITTKDREAAKSGKTFEVNRLKAKEEGRKLLVSEKEISPGIYMQHAGHWVMAKHIGIQGEKINLNVYTWGKQYTMEADITLAEFANTYAGFVAAFG